MPESQSYQNHVGFDPVWHFFIAPAMLVNLIVSIYETIHHWPDQRALFLWWIFLSIVLFMEVGRARQHSLIAQDRIIRLEEKLRFMHCSLRTFWHGARRFRSARLSRSDLSRMRSCRRWFAVPWTRT